MKRHPSHSRCAGRVRAETVLVVLLLGVVGWLLFKDATDLVRPTCITKQAESRPVMVARGELADDETSYYRIVPGPSDPPWSTSPA
jgi:hypothetical protein